MGTIGAGSQRQQIGARFVYDRAIGQNTVGADNDRRASGDKERRFCIRQKRDGDTGSGQRLGSGAALAAWAALGDVDKLNLLAAGQDSGLRGSRKAVGEDGSTQKWSRIMRDLLRGCSPI